MSENTANWMEGGLLLLCTRCFERVNPEDPTAADRAQSFRKSIKACLGQTGHQKFRAISASCLGVCPQDKLVSAVVNLKANSESIAIHDTCISPEELVFVHNKDLTDN